jgi:hypothetical protein
MVISIPEAEIREVAGYKMTAEVQVIHAATMSSQIVIVKGLIYCLILELNPKTTVFD